MGRERALRALRLKSTDQMPCSEVLEHPGIIQKVTGIDPYKHPQEAYLKALPLLDIDWIIDLPFRGVRFPTGQTTMTTADGSKITEWGCSGSYWEEDFGFNDIDEVLAYRPLDDTTGRVRVVGERYRRSRIEGPRRDRAVAGDAVLISGLYYTTLFQFGIMAFGWEKFLSAAALEPKKFSVVLDQFTEISVANVSEWVRDDCPVFFFHDDLAITRGLVFPPEWYRREIFPRYERILEPARAAHKIIVFVSDGRYIELIPDLMSLGIQGIFIDTSNDLAWTLENYGESHAVIGNIDTQIITYGGSEDIEREIRRCVDLGRRYPGYFLKSSGDLPHNIPLENMQTYFSLKRELGRRGD